MGDRAPPPTSGLRALPRPRTRRRRSRGSRGPSGARSPIARPRTRRRRRLSVHGKVLAVDARTESGSAPWKLKMDCFSSPTAKIVRGFSSVVLAALTREEFLGQRPHDLPLFGAGILRLVDQDVVEPAVELVEYPSRCFPLLQEREAFGDQIVVVEHAASALLLDIDFAHSIGQCQCRFGQQGGLGGAAAFVGLDHERAPFVQMVEERRTTPSLDPPWQAASWVLHPSSETLRRTRRTRQPHLRESSRCLRQFLAHAGHRSCRSFR